MQLPTLLKRLSGPAPPAQKQSPPSASIRGPPENTHVGVVLSCENIDSQQVAEAVEDLAHEGARSVRRLPASRRHTAKLNRLEQKALLLVPAFGQPADLDPLPALSRKFGLKVIEDGCEALGAEYRGRRIFIIFLNFSYLFFTKGH